MTQTKMDTKTFLDKYNNIFSQYADLDKPLKDIEDSLYANRASQPQNKQMWLDARDSRAKLYQTHIVAQLTLLAVDMGQRWVDITTGDNVGVVETFAHTAEYLNDGGWSLDELLTEYEDTDAIC